MGESHPPEPGRPSIYAPLDAGRKHFDVRTRTSAISLGVYRCGHTHIGRGDPELAPSFTVNFPRRGVYMKHVEGEEFLVDSSRAVFFNRGEEYCTSHPYGCGDAGHYIALRQDLALELACENDPKAAEDPARPFRMRHMPIDPRTELASRFVLADPLNMDALELDENVLALVSGLMRSSRVARDARTARAARYRGASSVTSPAQRELADAARGILARRFRERIGLDALARELGTSTYHLSRVFRAVHGTTLHAHRTRLRLACALDRLGERDVDLTALALELGFSSHSHFTERFRRGYGITPTELRAHARNGSSAWRAFLA